MLVGTLLVLALIALLSLRARRESTAEHPSIANQPAYGSEAPAGHAAVPAGQTTGPTLLYALSYQETAGSRRARPDQFNIFTADQAQKLVMVRRRAKNEIYAADLDNDARQVVFSDEGPSFEILPDGEQAFALGGGKAYARGIERGWRTAPSPGVFSKPFAIYELSLDGSNHWRKIVEIAEENPSAELFATTDGSKLGYLTRDYGKETVSIFALPEGKPLYAWDARKWSANRCPDGNFGRIGWLADGKTLFLTLQAPAGDEPAGPGCDKTYLLSEEGADLGLMSAESAETDPGKNSVLGGALFIGQATDGRNLFMTYRETRGQDAGWLMLATDSQKRTLQQAHLRTRPQGIFFWLSPSGQYLAFLEGRFDTKTGTSETHVWVKDLTTEKESDVAKILPVKYGSPEPMLSIHVLGVMDKKN